MGNKSNIAWTDATWNIARGCTKVDEDCKFCYMYRESFNGTRYEPKDVTRTKTVFRLPLTIKEPSRIFTSSLTDFFHEEIDAYRSEAWDIIRASPHHTFQILTKRPERIAAHLPEDWGDGWPNVWLGTSIGSQKAAEQRVGYLLEVPARVRFLSCEPLHSKITLTHIDVEIGGHPNLCQVNALTGAHTDMARPCRDTGKIHWVIVGGESGNENGKYLYRPCELEWLCQIIVECDLFAVPLFVKQMGTYLSKKWGLDDRHGTNMEEWPDNLRIREFPLV